jgi:hypothetical protein
MDKELENRIGKIEEEIKGILKSIEILFFHVGGRGENPCDLKKKQREGQI